MQGIVRIVLCCILLISAGIVTKLMATNMAATSRVPFDNQKLYYVVRGMQKVGVWLVPNGVCVLQHCVG